MTTPISFITKPYKWQDPKCQIISFRFWQTMQNKKKKTVNNERIWHYRIHEAENLSQQRFPKPKIYRNSKNKNPDQKQEKHNNPDSKI